MAILNSTIRTARGWFAKEQSLLIRISVIMGVLFAGAYLAPRIAKGGHQYPTLIFLTYLAVVAVVVALRWPIFILIASLVGGAVIPFTGPSGLNVSMMGVAFLLGIWFLDMLVRQRRFRFVYSKPLVPIYLLILISIISFGLGQLPWFTFVGNAPIDAQMGGMAIFMLSAGALILVANQLNNIAWLKAMVWIFIAFGSIYVFNRLFGLPYGDLLYQRGFSSGSMFWTWLVALSFGQLLMNRQLKVGWKIVLVGILAATMYVAYVQAGDWKSGWLPPLVSIAAILSIRYRKLAILLAPIGIYIAWIVVFQAISAEEYSWGTRVDAWLIVIEIAKVNPILGMGFANYYWYTPLFPIRGWSVVFNSHSQYVDLYAQVGIIGLILFLWIFWETGKLGWGLRERVTDGFSVGYVYGTLGGIAGTLVAAFLVDWVLPFVYNIGLSGFRASVLPWIFMGGLVAIEQMVRRSQTATQ